MNKILLLKECASVPAGSVGDLLHSRHETRWVRFGVCRVLELREGDHRFLEFDESFTQILSDSSSKGHTRWHLECLLCGHTEQWMGRIEHHYAVRHKLNHQFFQQTYRLPALGQDSFLLISKHRNQPVFLAIRENCQPCHAHAVEENLSPRDMEKVCA